MEARINNIEGDWSRLAVGPEVATQLAELEARCRHSSFGDAVSGLRPARRRGVHALFTGPRGTGKTLAAGILAAHLGRPLQRFDLAGVLNKYIGETEKNLHRIFAEAGRSGAVLLLDEADALFGRRTDVRDGHDRYANLVTGYLLQSIEECGEVVVLATNDSRNIDPAFKRRMHAVIEFPLPGAAERPRP